MSRLSILAASVLLFTVGSNAFANSYSWSQVAGGNWNVGGNWSPAGGPPGMNDNATLNALASPYAVQVTDAESATNLTIGSSSATLNLTGGNLTVGGTFAVNAGTFTLSGGTLNVNGSMTTMAGAAANWTGGTLTGSGTLAGTLASSGGSNTLAGVGLQNSGTFAYTGGQINNPSGAAAQMTNLSGGVLDCRSDGTVFGLSGGAGSAGTLVNQGTIRKSVGTGTSNVFWALDLQGGAIDTQTGTIAFNGGGTLRNATVNITGTGTPSLGGGTFTLPAGATFTAAVAGGVTPLTLSGGTLSNASGTLAGSMNWTGGTLTGSGTLSGTLVSSGGSNTLGGTGLQNSGTFAYTGGQMNNPSGAAAQLTNLIGGVFDCRSDGTVFGVNGGGTGTLVNQGTLRKSVGAGTSNVFWALDLQGGAIDTQTGTMAFNGGGTLRNATVNITGTGTPSLGGGTFTLLAGAIFTATAAGGATPLTLSGGTLSNANGTLAGSMNWTGGTLTGSGTLAGTLVSSGGANTLGGTGLQNGGTFAYTGGQMNNPSGAAAQLTNLIGGVFDCRSDGTVFGVNGGGTGTLVNQGTLRKSVGTGTSNVFWALDLQGGAIDTQTGTIAFNGGGTLRNATVNVTGTGTPSLGSGTFTLPAGATFISAVASGATPLTLSGGMLSDAGTLAGSMNWTGGTLTGSGTLAGTLASSGGSNTLAGIGLQNSGTFAYTGGQINNPSGAAAQLTNLPGGLLDFRSDGTVFGLNGGAGSAGTLVNQGTLRKSAGTGTSNVYWAVTNSGSVQCNTTGAINFVAGLTNAGVVTMVSGGTISGDIASNANGSVQGPVGGTGTYAGSLTFNAGSTLSAGGGQPGALVVNNNLTMTTSTTFFERIAGTTPVTAYSRVSVGGTVTLGNATLSGDTTGFTPNGTPVFILVNNGPSPVSGAFVNAPTTGSSVTIGGFTATISYAGNAGSNATSGGKDVVLYNFIASGPGIPTWVGGGGDNNWSTAANWSGGVPTSASTTAVTFAGTNRLAPVQDIASPITLNSVTFGPTAGAFALGGNGLNFVNNASTLPTLVQNSANAQTVGVPVTLTNNLTVAGSGAGGLTLSAAVTGAGSLTMSGGFTLTLTGANTYSGGTAVTNGTLSVPNDGALGASGAPVTVQPLGTLTYTGSTTTARSFTLYNSPLSAAAGETVTFNGATVGGGVLTGPGSFNLTGGTALVGMTTRPNTAVNVNGPASLTNVINGAALSVAAGLASPVAFAGVTNQGSGSITVGANSTVNAADFQTYGVVTLNPGSMAVPTQITNTGTTPLYFNGGSRTFLSIPAHAGQFDAGIDLHGNNATVAGGLFVNNGYVVDSVGAGTKAVIADFGSLVKGAGFYQNSVQTVNGGKFQSGNSPGSSSFGRFTFGPGGVSNYVFAIDDATGTAGPSPNASGQVSGWGLVTAVQRPIGAVTTPGDFTWTADVAHPLTVHLDTLVNPTTVGTDIAGPMSDFDLTRPYSWLAASWTGNYSGPADASALNAATAFDTTSFLNPIGGSFGLSLDTGGHSLSLTYTPSAVVEPGTLALTGLAGLGLAIKRRRRS
jgi:hypothetical protein